MQDTLGVDIEIGELITSAPTIIALATHLEEMVSVAQPAGNVRTDSGEGSADAAAEAAGDLGAPLGSMESVDGADSAAVGEGAAEAPAARGMMAREPSLANLAAAAATPSAPGGGPAAAAAAGGVTGAAGAGTAPAQAAPAPGTVEAQSLMRTLRAEKQRVLRPLFLGAPAFGDGSLAYMVRDFFSHMRE